MVSYPKRVRYTHKMYVRRHLSTLFSGNVSASMTVVGYPTDVFKLCLVASDICRIKITGSLDGVTVVERISFGAAGTQYSSNFFDTITSITSSYFVADTTLEVTSVDSVGMPCVWTQTYGPYGCEMGSLGGFQAQVDASALGLGTKIIHYVRVERRAPLAHEMEFTISPGYDGLDFVSISDFENICTPPSYIPQEWAFRAVVKTPGE